METPASILAFWLDDCAEEALTATQQSALWWSKIPHNDQAIRMRFASTLERLQRTALDSWAATARGTLALILLTDQLPRNMFRDTAQAFAYDQQALAWCKQGLARQLQAELRLIEQVFFYMPLEHSENLADQEQAVSLFTALLDQTTPAQRPAFIQLLDFALRHRDIIHQFGKFLHSNALLGRISTDAKRAFLQQKDSSF